MQVRLIAKTAGVAEYAGKSIDEIIVGQARLSSGRSPDSLFDEPEKLLRFCIQQGHWSIFALANLSFEVTTSRAMGRELLRHWSIRPQEYSQRYASPSEWEPVELRKAGKTNRQGSLDVTLIDDDLTEAVDESLNQAFYLYERLVEAGASRDCARMILPEATTTRLCMNGTIREWITALNVRLYKTAQKEVRLIAQAIRDTLIKECPIISAALYNFEDAEMIYILDRVTLEKYGVYEAVKSNGWAALPRH